MTWLLDRLKEKTTWLGLTALVTSAGIALSPELAEAIAVAGVAIAGLIAVVTEEKKK